MRVITLDISGKVVGVKDVGNGCKLGIGDIVTELGDMGQIQQVDGSFVNDPTPIIPQLTQPTNQELSDNQLILMDVLATMYEDMLAKGMV